MLARNKIRFAAFGSAGRRCGDYRDAKSPGKCIARPLPRERRIPNDLPYRSMAAGGAAVVPSTN
jgi:hypothetical protein